METLVRNSEKRRISVTTSMGLISTLAITCLVAGANILALPLSDAPVFLMGAKARLQREIDVKSLRSWVAKTIPNTLPKLGSSVRLADGKMIVPAYLGDDGFGLPSEYLPTNVARLFPEIPYAQVKYLHDHPGEKCVMIGFYGDRLGLFIRIGSTDTYETASKRWKDDIYVCIAGGG